MLAHHIEAWKEEQLVLCSWYGCTNERRPYEQGQMGRPPTRCEHHYQTKSRPAHAMMQRLYAMPLYQLTGYSNFNGSQLERGLLYRYNNGRVCDNCGSDERLENDHAHGMCGHRQTTGGNETYCIECVRARLCRACNQRDPLAGVPIRSTPFQQYRAGQAMRAFYSGGLYDRYGNRRS